jgi:hypothetical protein
MRGGAKKIHRMCLTVETKTQHGGCLKHVCGDCLANIHRLASIAERLALVKCDRDGVPSPLLEETYELVVRLGLVREKINPQWGPPASLTLARTPKAGRERGRSPGRSASKGEGRELPDSHDREQVMTFPLKVEAAET